MRVLGPMPSNVEIFMTDVRKGFLENQAIQEEKQ